MLERYFFSIYLVLLSGPVWSDEFSTIQDNINPGNIVIIGETHQKPESAQLFALLVDSALKRHQCLTVGLEINHNQQPAIDAVTKGETRVSEIKIPYAIDHPGMRKLIDYLAKLKSKTPCLRIEAIDADQDRDEHMADRLEHLQRDEPILVLLGGLHTLKKVKWTVKSGGPFVAEILVDHGYQVKSYPQRWLPERCENGQGRSSRYVSAFDPEALPILNESLMSLINAKRHRSTKDVIDGFVVWECNL
uniref:hypothetical protein n=1 Tax=Methylomonas sp. PHL2-19 TaxID=3438878 RepID=UPI00402B6884